MLILATLGLAAAAVPEKADRATARPICQNSRIEQAEQQRAQPRAHTLAAEPPASQILGVLRTVDGCTRPVVVREDVGAPRR